mgnify:CR=1 FL=1
MARELTAWLSIGSTYSYLTAMRVKEVCLKEDINLTIVPISIRQIMKSMDNIPFPPSKKTKVDYMWKDIERRAKLYKIPVPLVPAPYPLVEFDRANLVGIVMNDQGLYLDYFKYTYEEWFLNEVLLLFRTAFFPQHSPLCFVSVSHYCSSPFCTCWVGFCSPLVHKMSSCLAPF